ncbi:MAG: sigma-54 dependent transcriptional regulator [Thermodesulfobacteriota bacterium]
MDRNEAGSVRILVVDDEFSVRDSLRAWFENEGYTVGVAASGKEALAKLAEGEWDVFFLDLKMPGMGGLELQERIRAVRPDSTIIIITAYASVDSAVQAMKHGAYDYLPKPFDAEHLALLVRNVVERQQLVQETARLKKTLTAACPAGELIGASPAIKAVEERLPDLAAAQTPVLVRGESGTGKELVARVIHGHSRRRYAPFVTVTCGALPEAILEGELFGHEKGALAGAQCARKGKLELADGGTLFLDEVGDLSLRLQLALLEVLDDRRFLRLGASREIRTDFRLIAATNQDLGAAVAAGRCSRELCERLQVLVIDLPPLRERPQDIPLLAMYFLERAGRQMNKPLAGISPAAMERLLAYPWPGNVRELANALERAAVVARDRLIRVEDLPLDKTAGDESEARRTRDALKACGWSLGQAARLLQVDLATLYDRIRRYGLTEPGPGAP